MIIRLFFNCSCFFCQNYYLLLLLCSFKNVRLLNHIMVMFFYYIFVVAILIIFHHIYHLHHYVVLLLLRDQEVSEKKYVIQVHQYILHLLMFHKNLLIKIPILINSSKDIHQISMTTIPIPSRVLKLDKIIFQLQHSPKEKKFHTPVEDVIGIFIVIVPQTIL